VVYPSTDRKELIKVGTVGGVGGFNWFECNNCNNHQNWDGLIYSGEVKKCSSCTINPEAKRDSLETS